MLKVGDKVKRIKDNFRDIKIGDIAIVDSIRLAVDGYAIRLEGFEYEYAMEKFLLLEKQLDYKEKWF